MSGSVRSSESAYATSANVSPMVAARARSRDRLRLLAEAIEAEIVPRLLAEYTPESALTARVPSPRARTKSAPQNARSQMQAWAESAQDHDPSDDAHDQTNGLKFAPIPQGAVDLAAMVLREDESSVRAHVADAVALHGLEAVCLDLLAPAARHLGNLWDEDICSFSDVTIGLMRLQSALLAVTIPGVKPGIESAISARRTVLLAPAPGDQHSFGLTMVAGFLERAGWTVSLLSDGAPASIEAALSRTWFGVLGLSAGSSAKLPALGRMLPRLRSVSRNPDLAIMVGGPLFSASPDLAAEIGADSTAVDGPLAVLAAEALIAPRKVPRLATG